MKSRARSSRSATAAATVAGIAITHPDRVVYPDCGATKLELARYYESVADLLLPHIAGRPLTLLRCPTGVEGQCFFQKHWSDSLPEAVRPVTVQTRDSADQYLMIGGLDGLISLVQAGAIELHPWPCVWRRLEHPDRIVIDLDPGPGVSLSMLAQAAGEVRLRLEALDLQCFLRTSGGKGFHVVAPLVPRGTWDQCKALAKSIADSLEREQPERYVASAAKLRRHGKVFVDYLRNHRGATAIASYSARARAGAPIAAPVSWDDLSPRLRPDRYTIRKLPPAVSGARPDPWAGFGAVRQSVTARMVERALEGARPGAPRARASALRLLRQGHRTRSR